MLHVISIRSIASVGLIWVAWGCNTPHPAPPAERAISQEEQMKDAEKEPIVQRLKAEDAEAAKLLNKTAQVDELLKEFKRQVERGDYEEAEKVALKVNETDPHYKAKLVELMIKEFERLCELQHFDEARKVALKAREIDPFAAAKMASFIRGRRKWEPIISDEPAREPNIIGNPAARKNLDSPQ